MNKKLDTYKPSQRELYSKQISLITNLLNEKMGEYENIEENFDIKYTNEHIAELIFLNSHQVIEQPTIIITMAILIKYMNAYIIDSELSLNSIEKTIKNSKYAGIHYFLKQTLFDKQLNHDETVQVLSSMFKKGNKLKFDFTLNTTKDLLEETNQLYLQHIFYNKIEPSINIYKHKFQTLKDTCNKKEEKLPKNR